jgi:hypothetical protein
VAGLLTGPSGEGSPLGNINALPGGIWRFKNGALNKLAGFDRPLAAILEHAPAGFGASPFYTWPSAIDGKGGAATFAHPSTICAGSDDTFYFLDNARTAIRKVSLDGTVETLYASPIDGGVYCPNCIAPQEPTFPSYPAPGSPAAPQPSTFDLVCATNQRVFGYLKNEASTLTDLASGHQFGSLAGAYSATGNDLRANSWDYGFGNGLLINTGYIFDAARQALVNGWRINPSSLINPSFQLDNPPYVMPDVNNFGTDKSIVVDNNNQAYIFAGNALLRYKLSNIVPAN